MARFAHMSDIHLGGWKFPALQDLNFKSFQRAIGICISEKVDFVLMVGDIFDSPYPSIEILKGTFAEFKKLHDSGIKCFIIAGSHDYSVSGKTFLEVLEKTGFCKNVTDFEESEDGNTITLKPTIHEGVALYGFPGKKTGLEVQDLKKIRLAGLSHEMPKILMLHTTLDRVVGDLPIESVNSSELPKADYYALGHIHVLYDKDGFVYPGPMFPNNFKELEDLKHGHFVIADTSNPKEIQRIKIPLKEVEMIKFRVKSAITATEEAIFDLSRRDLKDKIVLLRFSGELENSKASNINFRLIEDFVMKKGAYFVLRNTHELKEKEETIEISIGKGDIGQETTRLFLEKSKSKFKEFSESLIHSLSAEKQEGETSDNFSKRIFDESRKILKF